MLSPLLYVIVCRSTGNFTACLGATLSRAERRCFWQSARSVVSLASLYFVYCALTPYFCVVHILYSISAVDRNALDMYYYFPCRAPKPNPSFATHFCVAHVNLFFLTKSRKFLSYGVLLQVSVTIGMNEKFCACCANASENVRAR